MADDINMTAEQLKAGMLSATAAMSSFTSKVKKNNQEYSQILEQLKKLNDNFKGEFQGTAKYLKQVVNDATGKSKTQLVKKDDLMLKMMNKLVKCVCKDEADINDFADKMQKNMEDLISVQEKTEKVNEEILKEAKKKQKVSSSGGMDTKNLDKEIRKAGKKQDPFADFYIAQHAFKFLEESAERMVGLFAGLNEEMSKITKSFNPATMAMEEQKFNREIRQTAYEVAGITGEAKNVQKAFADIGNTVKETGISREKFQEQYIKNLKVGITDLKVAQKITKQQLGTERLLGLEAGSLNDEFTSLNMSGRLTVAQTGAIGRGMIEVSRSTGVTGENLKKAVGSSQEFNKTLIKTAQFTAAASKNILEIVTNAEKFGVGDSVGNILKVATSTNELISGANKETSAFLYRAAAEMGRVQDLQYGTITRSKQGIKDLSMGMEKVLKQFGVESIEAVDNLTDEQKFKLNIQLKAAYGMELGEVVRTIDAFKQSGKGAADQLAEIAKKQKQNLNMEEKTVLLEQQRRIKASTAMSVVTALNESAKGAQNMNDALAKFNKRKDEFSADIKAIGGDLTNTTDGVGFAYQTAANELNARLKKLGKEPIKVDGKDIQNALKDKDAQAALAERLEKGFQELEQAEKNATDPMTQSYQTLLAINDTLKSYLGPIAFSLSTMVGSVGILAASGTAMATAGVSGVASKIYDAKSLGKMLGFDKEEAGEGLMSTLKDKVLGMVGLGKGGSEKSLPDAPESKARESERKAGKAADAKKGAGGGKMGKIIPDVDFKDVTAQLKSLGKLLLGTVAAILMVGIAIIAIGAIMQTVGKALKMDPLKLGLEVSKLLLAAAIIGTEVAIGFMLIDSFNRAHGKKLNPANAVKLWKLAKKLIIMTLAVVGLAMALLVVSSIITFGMSAKTAWKIAENVNSIILAAGTIILALVVASAIIIGLGWALRELAAAEPEVLGAAIFVGITMIPLAFAIVTLAAGLITFSNWILGVAGLDSSTIAQTVINVNMVVWGFNAIILGLAVASVIVIETGLLMTAVYGSLPGWGLALIGIGALFVIGAAIVLIMKALSWFMDSMIEAAIDSTFAKKSDAVIAMLDTVNSVLLRLAPIFVLAILGGIAAGYIMTLAPAVQAAAGAGIIAAIALLVIGPIIAMWLLYMYQAIVKLAISASQGIDVKAMQESTDKVIIMLDTVNGILLRILPMLGMILLLAGIVAGIVFLAASAGLAAAALAAGIVVFTVFLPEIIGLLINIGMAIVSAAQVASSKFSLDASAAKELTDKVWLISDTSMELGASTLTLASSAAFFNVAILIALVPMAILSLTIWSLLGYLGIIMNGFYALDKITNKIPFEDFMKLGFKIMMFATALNYLNLAMVQMTAMGVVGIGFFIGLAAYATFLFFAKDIIESIVIDYINIGSYVLLAATRLPLAKVTQSFGHLVQFTKSLSEFLANMQANLPSSTILTSMFSGFITEKPADKVRRYLGEIQQICMAAEGQNIKTERLEGTVALFDMLARWAKSFSSSMVDLSTAQSTMTSTVFSSIGNVFKKDLKKEIEDKLQNISDIITAVNTKSSTFSPATSTKAVAYMEEMSRVMKQFGTAMTGLAEGMEAAGKMRSMLWMLTTKKSKDGAKDSELAKMVGVTLDGINSLMPVIKGKIPDGTNFDEAVAKLEAIAPAMKLFGEVMGSFGNTMQVMFQQTSWGMGKKGPGTFLVENQQTIKTGMGDIFTALGEIFTGIKEKLGPELGKTAKIVAKDLNAISKQLTVINPALTNINSNLTSFIQAKKMSEQLQKTIGANAVKPDDSAQKLQQMSNMMGPLTSVFQQFGENLAPLTEKKGWLGFRTSLVEDVSNQATQVQGAIQSVAKLVNSIVNALKIVPDVKSFEDVNTKMKLMADMIGNLAPILTNFGTSMSKLTSKSGKDKPLTEFVKELTDKLGNDDTIKNIFDTIYTKMVDPLMAAKYNPDSIRIASQMIADMGVLLEGLSTSLNIISTSLMKTVSLGTTGPSIDGSLVAQVENQLTNSGIALSSIMGSLKTLVGNVLKVGASADIKEAAEIIKGLSIIIEELAGNASKPGLLQTLNSKISTLTEVAASPAGQPVPKNKLQKAELAISALADSLGRIMPSMTLLIDAVWKVGPSKEVKEAASIISGLTDLMNAVAGKPGQPGLIETINDGMSQLTEMVVDSKGNVSSSELKNASDVIRNMALNLPDLLSSMAKLVDVLVEKVGKASDVTMAAQTLKALPELFEGMIMMQAFTTVGLGMTENSFGMENNAIMQSLNGLMVFLKVLNGGVIDTLINDANLAINKLATLDQALLKLAQSFMSIGNNMQAIGQVGTQLSATGVDIAATTPQIAGTVSGQTAPGGGTDQRMQMQMTLPPNSNAEVVAQLVMVASAIGALANIESGAANTLASIDAGVNGGGKKLNAASTGGNAFAKKSLGGNSSDPTYAVGYNNGQPR